MLYDVGDIAWGNRWWMTWNTMLALVPACLAVVLFRHDHRRTWLWWAGLVTFVLFLPNAPYVVTDLVHLRSDITQTNTDLATYGGVLPLYAAYIAVGFGCYALALHEAGAALARTGRQHLIGASEMSLHALMAVGVLLGRIARLNSWDAVVEPTGTVERALDTLTWRLSPFVLAALFLTIWLGHAVTRALVRSASEWVASITWHRAAA